MELYQLRTFAAVAQAGHLTRAAEKLFISQPAVSAHIKALEEELGVVLFTRSARGMSLTSQGQALLERAEAVLSQAGELERAARALRHDLTGELKIALNTDAEFLRVRQLLAALRAEHPSLGVHLPQNMSHFIADDVRAGTLDGGFAYGECPPQGLEAMLLCSFRLVVVGPVEWRERLADATWADLAREPWVWYSDALPCHASVKRWIEPHSCSLSKVAVTDYEGTIRALVQSGAGMGIMRQDEGERCVELGEVFIWRGDSLPMNAYFLYRRDRDADPAIRAVLSALRRVWGQDGGSC
ncbi:MAG: LysR family transcriptional regulator [Desulfovibrio sp.]|nr:LysR family transcriptional regulator [Desulfovibrio sp.]